MEYLILEHPCLNIIFDDRRFEKYYLLIEELEKQQITNYKIWPCVVKDKVVESINASHKMIVRFAKEQGLEEVCIAEDDLLFSCETAFGWFLKNKPEEYDIYSAGNYLPFDKPEKHGAVKVKDIVGFHLYMVHSKYYDTFLATPDNDHIDTAQKSSQMFVCFPMPALQRSGWSSNNQAIVNYNDLFKDRQDYIYQ